MAGRVEVSLVYGAGFRDVILVTVALVAEQMCAIIIPGSTAE